MSKPPQRSSLQASSRVAAIVPRCNSVSGGGAPLSLSLQPAVVAPRHATRHPSIHPRPKLAFILGRTIVAVACDVKRRACQARWSAQRGLRTASCADGHLLFGTAFTDGARGSEHPPGDSSRERRREPHTSWPFGDGGHGWRVLKAACDIPSFCSKTRFGRGAAIVRKPRRAAFLR